MLRATSEIAVAIMVTSVNEKPRSWASWWPAWRAATMSSGWPTSTTTSSTTVTSDRFARSQSPVQQRETLLEVQRGVHVNKEDAELDHRERHFGLQPHDYGVGAAQLGHVCNRLQRPGGERIQDVDGSDVDDDAFGPVFGDPFHQTFPEQLGVGVGQGVSHRSDVNLSLFQNGYWHETFVPILVSARQFAGARYFVAQQVFGLLDAPLQVADGVHLGQVQP